MRGMCRWTGVSEKSWPRLGGNWEGTGVSEILGTGHGGSWLPRVFANGRELGGAEEVGRLHEAGELGKALEDCSEVYVEKEGRGGPCQACGDVRFVLCERCSGSCKVYIEKEVEVDEEEEEEERGDAELVLLGGVFVRHGLSLKRSLALSHMFRSYFFQSSGRDREVENNERRFID